MTVDLSTTLVVMPALNEEESIAKVIREVFAVSRNLTILVVDDGSEDATAQVARSAGARVASLPYNLGVGGAMRCGFRFARANGFDNVVQVDADGQHAPADIPRLISALAHADLVLGARFAGEGDYQARGLRRLAMIVLAKVLSRTTRTTLTDTTSGFRASGTRAVRLFARHYPAEYLGDTVESLVIAARANLVIRQVPVAMRERSGGTPSHSPLRATAYLARVGIGMVFALIRPKISTHAEERSQ